MTEETDMPFGSLSETERINLGMLRELRNHPEITTAKEKIDFIHQALELPYNELAEILPSEENGEIDTRRLDMTFSLASFLKEGMPDDILIVVRTPAPGWQDKTIITLLKEGQVEELFHGYVEAFG